jgi:hypothetical protein
MKRDAVYARALLTCHIALRFVYFLPKILLAPKEYLKFPIMCSAMLVLPTLEARSSDRPML